jgi:hypothetical protein
MTEFRLLKILIRLKAQMDHFTALMRTAETAERREYYSKALKLYELQYKFFYEKQYQVVQFKV